jgi:hypothetical protein
MHAKAEGSGSKGHCMGDPFCRNLCIAESLVSQNTNIKCCCLYFFQNKQCLTGALPSSQRHATCF